MKVTMNKTNIIMVVILSLLSGTFGQGCETHIYKFPDYECVDKNGKTFGSGSFEVAYRVKNKHTNEIALMKFSKSLVDPHTKMELALMTMFKGEDNIIQLIDFNQDFMIVKLIEFAQNGDLHSWLLKQNNIAPLTIMQIYRGIVNGIKIMHEKGYAHLDLKLENVVLMADLTPKLIDFGLSEKVGNSGVPRGTPIYFPFEMIGKSHVQFSKKMDMYSLGVLLYEMTYQGKRLPFEENMQDLLLSKHYGVFQYYPGMYKEFLGLISQLSLRDPSVRLTADQLLDEIDRVIQENKFTLMKSGGYYGERGEYRGMVYSQSFLIIYDLFLKLLLILGLTYFFYNKYNLLHSNKNKGLETELETQAEDALA